MENEALIASKNSTGKGQMDRLVILNGDALTRLRELPDESIQCCCTSPPYWGLRNYGVAGQPGMEKTPEEYTAALVAVLSQVKRTLRRDGTLWLNLGDSYVSEGKGNNNGQEKSTLSGPARAQASAPCKFRKWPASLKRKDLVGIPWIVAFALRADGWYLRSEITWCKKVPMPESVTDRPTSATEKIFLFSKSPKYFYDADAVRNPPLWGVDDNGRAERNGQGGFKNASGFAGKNHGAKADRQRGHSRRHAGFNDRWDAMEKAEQCVNGSNMRNFWLLGPDPYPESHFATFPREVPKRCILAGSKPGDTILDPFAGSGTTGAVALGLGRKAVLIELNPEYCKLIERRCDVTLGFEFKENSICPERVAEQPEPLLIP